jgi:hypothetical protein
MLSEPRTLLAFTAIVAAVLFLSRIQRRYRLLQYLFWLRFPLLHAAVLLLLPLAVRSRAFGNLFVLTPVQLGIVAFLTMLSTWAVIQASGLVFVGAASRFRLRFRQPDLPEPKDWDADPPPNRLPGLLWSDRARAYVVAALVAMPILIVAFLWSPGSPGENAIGIAIGIGMSVALRELTVMAGRGLRRWFYRPQPAVPSSRLLKLRPWIRDGAYRFSESLVGRILARPFLTGYSTLSSTDAPTIGMPSDESRGAFSHWRAASLFILVLVVYAIGAWALNPTRDNFLARETPALAYLLLVVTLFGLLGPAVTFFFDLYRTPALVVLALLLFAASRYSDLDHYYKFSTEFSRASALPRPLTAAEMFTEWAGRHSPQTSPGMVVVASSGGGSHAARWTAEVLAQLMDDPGVGERFFESTTFLSLVSGGALGGMYAVEGFSAGPPTSEALWRARDAASHSNVQALAWGLAYPDLVRKLLPSASIFDRDQDRAWAIEQAWESARAVPRQIATLASWDQDARRGIRPAVVFNATAMETGRRLLLSRLVIPGSSAHQFAEIYPGRDLSIVTAVRLSSGFPYLLPMARPLAPDRRSPDASAFEKVAYHVADGGYYDNSGVLTAIEFINSVLPTYRTSGRTRVLLVQILTALDASDAAGNQGWVSALAMPPAAALNVSRSSQEARAELELRLLAERWNNEDLPQDKRVLITPIVFRLRDTGTLPWHLSEREKESISRAWNNQENQNALRVVRTFFSSP